MTTQEIKALIAAKIAGQGSMVDAGGALPVILDAIVDAIDAITPGEVLSFAEPLKKSGTDVSLQIGSGLGTDTSGISINPLLLVPKSLSGFSGVDKEEAADKLNITTSELDALFDGKYPTILFKESAGSGAYRTLIPLRQDINDGDIQRIYFYNADADNGMAALLSLFCEDGSYTFGEI